MGRSGICRFGIGRSRAGLRPLQSEQLAYLSHSAINTGAQCLHFFACFCRKIGFFQRFGLQRQCGEGGAQFMCCICNKAGFLTSKRVNAFQEPIKGGNERQNFIRHAAFTYRRIGLTAALSDFSGQCFYRAHRAPDDPADGKTEEER